MKLTEGIPAFFRTTGGALALAVLGIVLVAIDYQLITDSLEKLEGKSVGVIALIFTACTAGGPTIAAYLRRRLAVGSAVPGGRVLPAALMLVWVGTVIAVTGIRIVAGTLSVNTKPDNAHVPGQTVTEITAPKQIDQFIANFDPLSSDVLLAFAMILPLVLTGLVSFFVGYLAHNPVAAVRKQADILVASARAELDAATVAVAAARADVATHATPAALERDAARLRASQDAVGPLEDAVAERIRLRMAEEAGDPEATTRLTTTARRPRVRQNIRDADAA